MKVLLIQPNYRRIYAYAEKKEITPIFPPLGLAYIAAVLRRDKIDVKILEANAYDLTHEQIKIQIEEFYLKNSDEQIERIQIIEQIVSKGIDFEKLFLECRKAKYFGPFTLELFPNENILKGRERFLEIWKKIE